MDDWKTHTEHWLSHEQHGLDDAAEAAFRQAFAALPVLQPSDGFLTRAVDAAWRARVRRRRTIAVTGLAASLLVAAIGSTIAIVVFNVAGGWLLNASSAVMTSSALAVLMAAANAAEWWSATALAGRVMADVVATPQGVTAVVTVEILGATATWLLQRLLRADVTLRAPGPLCV